MSTSATVISSRRKSSNCRITVKISVIIKYLKNVNYFFSRQKAPCRRIFSYDFFKDINTCNFYFLKEKRLIYTVTALIQTTSVCKTVQRVSVF